MTKTGKRLGVLALVAATYSMVAGGPFGLEDLVSKAGYKDVILILLATAFLWALPTALMVGELSSALPKNGGFYVWVARALGPFWGFQEAWLSLVGSVFDMAIYPTLFAAYITHLFPRLGIGHMPILIGVAMIGYCVAWNLCGAHAVGKSSLATTIFLLVPFAFLAIFAMHRSPQPATHLPLSRIDFLGGILIAMWNFMGWDNASTIAEKVERPERNYIRAMLIAVAAVTASYTIPILAVWHAGLDPNSSAWSAGGWVDIARFFGGEWLSYLIAAAGALAALDTFNALVLSLSQLPAVLANDGFLPKLFARENRRGVPWVAVIVFAIIWGSCLNLGFERTVMLDVLLTGLSILLEFMALIYLPLSLPRVFRIPGGRVGKILIAIPPATLIVFAIVRNHSETIGPVNALTVGMGLIALGGILYLVKICPKKF